jgi:hypothetical protein
MNKVTMILFLVIILVEFVFAQKEREISNLESFAKVYGYVRYFHPSDEAADCDWNQFVIHGCDEILKCNSDEEVRQTLKRLFDPIAPSLKFYKSDEEFKFDSSSISPGDPKKYQSTYWQHLGVSIGMKYQNSIYQSIRVNARMKIDHQTEGDDFGNVMTYLSATPYNGKKIKFSGWVKMAKGIQGTGHLWLRVDNPDNKIGFFENMDNNPIVANEWKQYEIIGEADTNSNGIALGCFLEGSGELFFDNFNLSYQENGEWKNIPVKNSDFEKEEIATGKMKGLTWKGRGKGYDFRLLPDSTNGRLGSIKKSTNIETHTGKKIFEARPWFKDAIQRDIGSGTTCMIPTVLYIDKNGTWPAAKNKFESNQGNQGKNNSAELTGFADVIIAWNVFQHFYPYFDVVHVDWEEQLKKALSKTFKDKSDEDFLVTLEQMTAPLHDGHISIIGKDPNNFMPGIAWEFIERKLVITKVCDDNTGLKPGDIVTKVNGQAPEKYFEYYESLISAGTTGWLDYRTKSTSLYGTNNSILSIEINNKTVDLIRNISINKNCYDESESGSNFKFIDRDIIYLNLSFIEMKTIDSLLPALSKAKAIICDLRGYPNDNHDLISYLLTSEDTDNQWMQIPEIIYPDHERVTGYWKEGWLLKPKKPHLNAKIIFLTDGRAISYAESYLSFIEGYKLATIVGQPTAGTNGNINPFRLPGGFEVSWTGMKVVKQDGSQHHGIGIRPNVYVSKTIKGLVEGRDEYLEKAIELAHTK